MTSKQYTERSNCVRAAKAALGKDAKPDVDFIVHEKFADVGDNHTKFFTWSKEGYVAPEKPAKAKKAKAAPKTKAKKAKAPKKTRPAKGSRRKQDQPQNVKMLNLMRRKSGATVEQIQEALGGLLAHSVRSAISVCRDEGAPITMEKNGRKGVFFMPPKVEPV